MNKRQRNLLSVGAVGSNSRSLGGNDPRIRRNTSQLGVSDTAFSGPMRIDKSQRLTIAPANGVPKTAVVNSDDTLSDVATSLSLAEANLNNLVQNLVVAGFIKGV